MGRGGEIGASGRAGAARRTPPPSQIGKMFSHAVCPCSTAQCSVTHYICAAQRMAYAVHVCMCCERVRVCSTCVTHATCIMRVSCAVHCVLNVPRQTKAADDMTNRNFRARTNNAYNTHVAFTTYADSADATQFSN